MAIYLDFENSIKQIDEDIASARIKADTHAVEILEKELDKEVQKTYKNLTDYQKLQLARHPDRPYAIDYIRLLLKDSYEIHGDRAFAD
ncbi:MAG TPA: acetyl-CoA carboxylase carboxyl transferase subunit alpha, partial [Sulfurospirillum sp. UBA11407]